MGAQIAKLLSRDIQARLEGGAETWSVTGGLTVLVIVEGICLQRRVTLFTHFLAHRLNPIEIVNSRRVIVRLIDPPSRAMRPVEPDTVAHLTAEQLVTGYIERLPLSVEQCVLNRAQPLCHNAAGGRPRVTIKFSVDPLMRGDILADNARRHAFDDRRHAG